MFELDAKTLRLAIATAVIWAASGAIAWFAMDTNVALVGAKGRGAQSLEVKALQQVDLATEQTLLEKTSVWPMQRDGLPPAVKTLGTVVEKKIIWSIAATVVRPKQSYLLVQDKETKLISQVNIGDLLPDGSKLLQVAIGSYVVRASDGKKRTVDTSH